MENNGDIENRVYNDSPHSEPVVNEERQNNHLQGIGEFAHRNDNLPMDIFEYEEYIEQAHASNHPPESVRSINGLRRICTRGICARGMRRLRNRGRGHEQGIYSRSNNEQHLDMLGRVPSSPDGFSSDSIMDEDQLSHSMSSISDFDEMNFGRLFPADAPSNSAGSSFARSFQDITTTSRFCRGNKRTRTGSSSSDSSFDAMHNTSRKHHTTLIESDSHKLVLVDKFQKLRQEKEFTDVILEVDKTEIPCHRVVLAACSPYFHALLGSSMKEAKEGKVNIQGQNAEVVQMLVRHAYCEPVKITTDNAQDVLEAADYFQMDTLKDYCEKFLIRQVAESNCLGLVQFAKLHSLESLYRKAKRFAIRNFAKVSLQEEFVCLPLQNLVKYLSDNFLAVQREEHVYEAAIRWLEHEEPRKQHAAVVLRSVRLFFVNSRFLFEVVSKNAMLQGNPAVQDILSEACKYHAIGSTEWRQSKLPHTRPRASSGISEVLVVVGGICNNRRLLYTESYNAFRREWFSLCDISTSHATMHSYSVCSHKNDIYITGGHSNSGMTVDAVSVYFSNINQWSALSSMQCPRERHGSASVDGAVYVAGGLMASPKNRKKPGVLSSVERYKPLFNKWEKIKPLPKRCYSPGVLSYKEKLYVIGGVSMTEEVSNSSKVTLDCIQCYDPLKDSWSLLPLGRPLARLSCALYGDNFYIISNNASSIFRYNPATTTLEEWAELKEANVEFAGLAAFNGKLIISGGQKGNTTLNQMFVIDFESGKVEEETKMKRSRCMHGCVPIDKFG